MTSQVIFANNAGTTLAAPITSSATTATLTSGTGALFPSPASGQFFTLTLQNAANPTIFEVTWCTARSGDTVTLLRAQEGTTGLAWNAGDLANNVITAGALNLLPQTAEANTWTKPQSLSGGATAPTEAVGDNTTNVATTAFVKSQAPFQFPAGPGTVITANTTFTGANAGNTYSVVGPVVLSLTTASFAVGQTIGFVPVGAGASTIQTSGSALIVGAGVSSATLRTPVGSLVTLQFDGTNFRILSAYRLIQNQPVAATNSVLVAAGASGTAATSLFAQGPGIVTAVASRNLSFQDTVGHLTNLVLNGAVVATDTAETSMTHLGLISTAGGVTITADYSSSVTTPSCSLNVLLTFIPFN